MKNKVLIAEERAKDAERKNIILQSEFDKKQVLLLQKVDYLQKHLEEQMVKEKQLTSEYN